MQIQTIDIEGFRSLRNLGGKLHRLNVIVGPNGVGKSNLYRSLELINFAAQRQLARAVAAEGGMTSIRWAGRKIPKSQNRIRIFVEWDDIWNPSAVSGSEIGVAANCGAAVAAANGQAGRLHHKFG